MTFKEMLDEFQCYMLDPYRRRKDEFSQADIPSSRYNGDGSESAFLPHILGIIFGLAVGRWVDCGFIGYIISVIICIFLIGFFKSHGIDGLSIEQSARMNLIATLIIVLISTIPVILALIIKNMCR